MRDIVRSFKVYPGLALGSVVLWGVFEFVALQRSHLKAWAQQFSADSPSP